MNLHLLSWILALPLAAIGCALNVGNLKPLEVVPYVDIYKYLGSWHEIARYPNRFQRDCVNSRADYRLRDDGDIRVLNMCNHKSEKGSLRSSEGKAWIVDKNTNAKLKVRFFWPFSGDYWILDLGKDYEYAVVGTPSRKYLWVLSRKPKMEAGKFREILSRIEKQGYDPKKLIQNPGAVLKEQSSQAESTGSPALENETGDKNGPG